MPNHVTHPPSDVCVEQLPNSVLGKEQAARLCALMEQTGHFPLAGLRTVVVVAKEGSDGMHGNSGSGHGTWGWLTP